MKRKKNCDDCGKHRTFWQRLFETDDDLCECCFEELRAAARAGINRGNEALARRTPEAL